jgi:hypothetical protein
MYAGFRPAQRKKIAAQPISVAPNCLIKFTALDRIFMLTSRVTLSVSHKSFLCAPCAPEGLTYFLTLQSQVFPFVLFILSHILHAFQ